MKIKARLDKIEQALNEADTAGKPVFRVFHEGEEIPQPEPGILHVIFQMPKPMPVPEEFSEKNERKGQMGL